MGRVGIAMRLGWAVVALSCATSTPRSPNQLADGADGGAPLEPSKDEQLETLVRLSHDASAEAEQRDRDASAPRNVEADRWRPGPDDGSDRCLRSGGESHCCGDASSPGKRVAGRLVCPRGWVPQWMCRGCRIPPPGAR